MPLLEIVRGDITHLQVDAIVNAANETLLGGGGVDGAIHRAAGPALFDACKALPEVRPSVRCPIGEARITPGFDLPARFVIHTVGPRYRGAADDAMLLASCYRQSLALAATQLLHSVAFPSISTGAFGYPIDRASEIAVRTCRAFFEERSSVGRVVLVAYSSADAGVLARTAATPARTTLH